MAEQTQCGRRARGSRGGRPEIAGDTTVTPAVLGKGKNCGSTW